MTLPPDVLAAFGSDPNQTLKLTAADLKASPIASTKSPPQASRALLLLRRLELVRTPWGDGQGDSLVALFDASQFPAAWAAPEKTRARARALSQRAAWVARAPRHSHAYLQGHGLLPRARPRSSHGEEGATARRAAERVDWSGASVREDRRTCLGAHRAEVAREVRRAHEDENETESEGTPRSRQEEGDDKHACRTLEGGNEHEQDSAEAPEEVVSVISPAQRLAELMIGGCSQLTKQVCAARAPVVRLSMADWPDRTPHAPDVENSSSAIECQRDTDRGEHEEPGSLA